MIENLVLAETDLAYRDVGNLALVEVGDLDPQLADQQHATGFRVARHKVITIMGCTLPTHEPYLHELRGGGVRGDEASPRSQFSRGICRQSRQIPREKR